MQVAFDHFYDITASCTLYTDRNCVNRRNVTCEVDKNFSACKQFFRMEVEARVIAAALDHMNLTTMNDIPSEDILPPTLIDDTSEVQKQFLKNLVCNIVDKYIVNEDSINDCIKEIENHSRNVGLLENGRYACRFAGCKKSFAFNGKHRIAHEATHGLYQSMAPITGTTIPPTRDDVRNYQLAVLEYGLLYLKFLRCYFRR